ncbi:hypothetical protein [Catenovulum adriaticum]|uniref:Uncharacterized protein n=1 Tax=Catenovulum adriaticum TaxID=2984846 RepID=A0ABY7APG3_9ALTE|nr:hypothetical protein [Catenovulum sp. TS8]WAJ71463.1 hypothetical protein OLW01_06610 [Catenovulum sp. TS8]
MLTLKKVTTVLGVSIALFASFSSFANTQSQATLKQDIESNIQTLAKSEIAKLVTDLNTESAQSFAVKVNISNAIKSDKKAQPEKLQTLTAE